MLLFRTRAAGVKLAGLLDATLLETGSEILAPLILDQIHTNHVEPFLPGPRAVAVKLIHTVNDSSNRIRVAAQVTDANWTCKFRRFLQPHSSFAV